jgi:hypothetical protein
MKIKHLVSLILVITLTLGTISVNSTNDNTDLELDSTDWKWDKTTVISTVSTSNSWTPSISIDSTDNIHVVWDDFADYGGSGADRDIFYKKFDSNTNSWGTTFVISTESTGHSAHSEIATDSVDNIHVVWDDATDYGDSGGDGDIFYKKYNNSTDSWGTTVVVSTESTANSWLPSIAVDSLDNIHVVWGDKTDYDGAGTLYDIFYKKYNNSTDSWGTTIVVSTESTGWSEYAKIAIDSSNNIHVVWQDDYNGTGIIRDIFYKNFNSITNAWGTTILISSESSDKSFRPSIAIDNADNIHVVWYDETDYGGSGDDKDIFYKKFDSNTNSWGTTVVISTESISDSYVPEIAIDKADNIHVVWYDITNYGGSGFDSDIFYKKFDSNTKSWSTTHIVSSESTSSSSNPIMTIDRSGLIHVVWDDETDYNGSGVDRDIFYKRYYGTPPASNLEYIGINPTKQEIISLEWDEIDSAIIYNIYRDNKAIFSIENLTQIANTTNNYYYDILTESGLYYYVVIGINSVGEGKISNNVFVEVILQQTEDFQNNTDDTEEVEDVNDSNLNEPEENGFFSNVSYQPIITIITLAILVNLVTKGRRR